MTTTLNPVSILDGDISFISAPACRLCRASGTILYEGLTDWLWGVPGEWGLRQCACGLAWLDPQPSVQDIPKLYAKYYTHSAIRTTRMERIRREVSKCVLTRMGYPVQSSSNWLATLLSHVPPIARAQALEVFNLSAWDIGTLLDVGCGNGEFIRRMVSLRWDACGVDPDPAAVAFGLSQGLKVFEGTIWDVPTHSHYDVITLNHVIEHLHDPISLLAECRKRLTPSTGRLIITTPNFKSLGHRWFGRYWRGLETPRHLQMFSAPALRNCVLQAGLSVTSLRTETRLARMIYNPSACATTGETRIGKKIDFRPTTKAAAWAFQAIEDLVRLVKEDAGEELFCVCTAE